MATPRARFLATTDAMRILLEALSRFDEVSRVVVNPIAEDVERGSDRIHAVFSDGTLSETVLVTAAADLVVEAIPGRGRASFPTWMIPDAAVAFMREAAMERRGPGARRDDLPIAAASIPSMPMRAERFGGDDAPGCPSRPIGPRARFRTTTDAASRLKAIIEANDRMRGLIVNPNQGEVDPDEDVLRVVLADGDISSTALYCSGFGYAVARTENTVDVPRLSDAVRIFIDALTIEVEATSSEMTPPTLAYR